MLWKCCTQSASKSGKLCSGHRPQEKVSFHSNPKERQCQRVFKLHNYCTTAFISHTNKVRFQILQARFQQYVKWELLDVQARFRKGEGSRNQILASIGSQKMQGNSRKTSTSVSLTMLKPLTVWITANCGKFFKRWEYQTTLPASWETCVQDS